jgi:hypothetical protein
MQIKYKEIINIIDIIEAGDDNTDIVCKLYRKFEKISLDCFLDDYHKQLLCYDQMCIYLDSINDNMCKVENISCLICIIYESGLCDVSYDSPPKL